MTLLVLRWDTHQEELQVDGGTDGPTVSGGCRLSHTSKEMLFCMKPIRLDVDMST